MRQGLVDQSEALGGIEVVQPTHDDLNANVNLQIDDTDVSCSNPVPVSTAAAIDIAVTPTISAAAIYAGGDALGGRLEFANAVRVAAGGGIITKVVIIDEDQELAPVDLVLFSTTFTATVDNAPFDPTDADLANCIGYIDVAHTDYADFVDNSIAAKASGLRMPFQFKLSTGTTLYGQLVVRDAPTYTATDDLTVIITVERC